MVGLKCIATATYIALQLDMVDGGLFDRSEMFNNSYIGYTADRHGTREDCWIGLKCLTAATYDTLLIDMEGGRIAR